MTTAVSRITAAKPAVTKKANGNPNEIVWENPPAQTHGNAQFAALLDSIKVRPHEWARIRTYRSRTSVNMTALRARFPEFEFRTARTTDGIYLYAKYTPAE